MLAQSELRRSYIELAKFVGDHTHIIDQIKRGAQLEDTMPVGEAEREVLVWVLVGSSRLDVPPGNKTLISASDQLQERNN